MFSFPLQGNAIEFIDVDESNRQWIMDFRSKALSNPHKLEEMDSEFINKIVLFCTTNILA